MTEDQTWIIIYLVVGVLVGGNPQNWGSQNELIKFIFLIFWPIGLFIGFIDALNGDF